jgi:hypothetical protein
MARRGAESAEKKFADANEFTCFFIFLKGLKDEINTKHFFLCVLCPSA